MEVISRRIEDQTYLPPPTQHSLSRGGDTKPCCRPNISLYRMLVNIGEAAKQRREEMHRESVLRHNAEKHAHLDAGGVAELDMLSGCVLRKIPPPFSLS